MSILSWNDHLLIPSPPADLSVEGGEGQSGVKTDQGLDDRAQIRDDPDHAEQDNDCDGKEGNLKIVGS